MRRKNWPPKGGTDLSLRLTVGGEGKIYLLDNFTTNDPSPVVSPRNAEPGPGTLITTDTGGHCSINAGYMVYDGNAGNGDPLSIYNNALTRKPGTAMLSKVTPLTALSNGCYWGFANSVTPGYANFAHLGLRLDSSSSGSISGYDGSALYPIGILSVDDEFELGIVLASPGVSFIIKDGNYDPEWFTLLYHYQTGTSAIVYSVMNYSYNSTHKQRNIIVKDLYGAFTQNKGPHISFATTVLADTTIYAPINGLISYTWTPGAGETLEISWRYKDDNNRMVVRCIQATSKLQIFSVDAGVETQYGTDSSHTWTVGSPAIINIMYDLHTIKTWVNNGYKSNTINAVYNNGYEIAKVNLAGANLAIYPRHLDINGTEIKKYWASRAATYLTTPTADATGQAVHPDVVHIPGGWNGYEYWMTMTGYFNADASTEEPHILASNDKVTWEVPIGLVNPLYNILGGDQTSDSDIILGEDNNLWCIWRETNGVDTDTIRAKYSSDGVNWSALQTLFTAGMNEALSPAILWNGAQYIIYSVNDSTHNLERRVAITLPGVWSSPDVLVTHIPGGTLWHIDVIYDNGLYYAVYCGKTPNYSIGIGTSVDGLTWKFQSSMMYQGLAGMWDKGVYRACIVKTSNGFDMWYSANDEATPQNWFIGYTTIQK